IAVSGAVLFALASYTFRQWWVVLPFSVLFTVLLSVSVIDLRVYRIPDRIVFPSLVLSLPLLVIAGYGVTRDAGDTWRFTESALVGMAVYFGILLPFNLIYPRGMGFGDVKLALVMGLYLGWLAQGDNWQAAYFILIALMLGCILGVV